MKQYQSILEAPFEVSIPCLRLKQPIGEFFIATIPAKILCSITYADVRRMEHEREFETYLGIQRPLSSKRVKEIAQYVRTVDACFPSAVILAVDGKCVEFNERAGRLVLRNYITSEEGQESITSVKIAKVLDGQHRIAGLQNFDGDFDVNVSIFVEMDIESQAYVFSTVNLAQTKVNKNLVYDLFELARTRSPQKTAHKIAVALNNYEGGAFYQRIKRLGTATEGRFTETLSQATFVESLIPYLTPDKIADRDIYKRGKRPNLGDTTQFSKCIFRKMFIDECDLEIADIISNFFEAVAARWPIAWQSIDRLMLSKTNGFKAFMRFLRPAYLHLRWKNEIPSTDDFSSLLSKVSLDDEDFTVDNFQPGTGGESALFLRLMADTNLSI